MTPVSISSGVLASVISAQPPVPGKKTMDAISANGASRVDSTDMLIMGSACAAFLTVA